jgi:DNA-binding MarR family transcriptional regulator
MLRSMALDALERIAFATVAVTSAAIGDTAGHELTFLAWRTLVVLGSAGRPLRMSDLAERLGISRPSASKLVRRLERRGLLELGSDESDGRVLLVGLSGHGAELRASVVARRREILATALADPLPGTLGEGLAALAERLEPWV